jgi:hypothetical protein
MISWLHISSINNIIFILYETNNTYIKETVGSMHNLVYSKLIEFVFLLFILGYMLVINKEINYNYTVIVYGMLHGVVTCIEEINFCYLRETNKYNIEKMNYITISMFEYLTGKNNYNANYLFSSYLIALGSFLIDMANINNWFINKYYFDINPIVSTDYDLETPLLDDGYYENIDYKRDMRFNKYAILHIFTINLNDIVVKTTISGTNILTEITVFYVNSLLVSTLVTILFITIILKRDLGSGFDIENKTNFFMRYILRSVFKQIYILNYSYAIIIAPSIIYVKAISKSWSLILLESMSCHNNIINANDFNIFGSLVIVYPTVIFYLTSYYKN